MGTPVPLVTSILQAQASLDRAIASCSNAAHVKVLQAFTPCASPFPHGQGVAFRHPNLAEPLICCSGIGWIWPGWVEAYVGGALIGYRSSRPHAAEYFGLAPANWEEQCAQVLGRLDLDLNHAGLQFLGRLLLLAPLQPEVHIQLKRNLDSYIRDLDWALSSAMRNRLARSVDIVRHRISLWIQPRGVQQLIVGYLGSVLQAADQVRTGKRGRRTKHKQVCFAIQVH